MDKILLRQDCRERIGRLTASERAAFSAEIRAHLQSSAEFLRAGSVFAYAALADEPDLGPLLESHPEKTWSFPKVESESRLSFFTVASPNELTRGSYGISEPETYPHHESAPTAEIILIPGIGFDASTMARLGRGRGYYDRFLEKALVAIIPRPLLVGICFSTQLSTLPSEPHDIPMDRILTERGWIGRLDSPVL